GIGIEHRLAVAAGADHLSDDLVDVIAPLGDDQHRRHGVDASQVYDVGRPAAVAAPHRDAVLDPTIAVVAGPARGRRPAETEEHGGAAGDDPLQPLAPLQPLPDRGSYLGQLLQLLDDGGVIGPEPGARAQLPAVIAAVRLVGRHAAGVVDVDQVLAV